MKLAIIAPIAMLDWTAQSRYQMCLARLVLRDKRYRNHYRSLVERGDFVIMDNGAAEEGTLDLPDLLKAAVQIKPSQIVVPDKVNNTTVTKMLAADCRKLEEAAASVMVVPQGSTIGDLFDCLDFQLRWFPHAVIGLSKYCPVDRAFTVAMLDARMYLVNHYVHLLGIQRYPQEVRLVTHAAIRGIDTGAPVAYGLAHKELSAVADRESLNFDSIYAEGALEQDAQRIQIQVNIATMKEWCDV